MSARFLRTGAPANPPGCCLSCRSGSDPIGFYDLGTLIGFELAGDQTAYLCISRCLLELVRDLGYTPPEVLQRTQDDRSKIGARMVAEKARADALELVVTDGVLAMLERITMDRIRQEVERVPADDGGAAAGGDGGGGEPGPAGQPAGEPTEPDGGTAAGPRAGRRGGPRRSTAGAGAGPAGNG